MLVPENIVVAVRQQTNQAEVAEAQRARDASVWSSAVMYRRKHSRRPDWEARYATMYNMARFRAARIRGLVPENKVERCLLDKAHRVSYNTTDAIRCMDMFVTVLAIQYNRRNPA